MALFLFRSLVCSTVATYQTLAQGNRLNKFDPSRLKAIIVDEAHHATAPSYLRILSYFNSDIASTNHKGRRDTVPIVGFSATFSRHDGLALGKVFQEIVYHQDFLEMISDKWYVSQSQLSYSHSY